MVELNLNHAVKHKNVQDSPFLKGVSNMNIVQFICMVPN